MKNQENRISPCSKKIIENEEQIKSFTISNENSENDKNYKNELFLKMSNTNELGKNVEFEISKFSSRIVEKKKKILLVDDNQFITDSIKLLMNRVIREYKLDLEIIECSDGIDMIKLIVDDQTKGNLILSIFTDENMEYINGSVAIKIIRDLEKKNKIKRIKIYSVSSHEDRDSAYMILNAGADTILGKPVSKFLIINCFKEMNLLK